MFWSDQYASLHLIAIALGVAMLVIARVAPRVARGCFLALFAWACTVNWRTTLTTPEVYLEYADLTVLELYRQLITGVFAQHITLLVGTIATCQGLIALGLFWGGAPARVALRGAITFLMAITPLGVGSGFPSTVFMAVGCYRLLHTPHALHHNVLHALRNALKRDRSRPSSDPDLAPSTEPST